MCGPFNSSGSARHALWSATLFDGVLKPGTQKMLWVELPRRQELPATADDGWLLVTARARLVSRMSRPVWLAVAEDGKPVTTPAGSV